MAGGLSSPGLFITAGTMNQPMHQIPNVNFDLNSILACLLISRHCRVCLARECRITFGSEKVCLCRC